MKILPGASPLPQRMFLIQFLFKIDEIPPWGLPPHPAHVSYSIRIQNSFKINEHPLWSLPPPPVHAAALGGSTAVLSVYK